MDNQFNKIIQIVLESTDPESGLEQLYFEDDAVDGAEFDHKGYFYHVILNGYYRMIDDSDYNREVGYGKAQHPEVEQNLNLSIREYDEKDQTLRDQDQIEKDDPILYKNLLEYARNKAIESISR